MVRRSWHNWSLRKRKVWHFTATLLVLGLAWLSVNSGIPDQLRVVASCLMLVALAVSLVVGVNVYDEIAERKRKGRMG